MNKENKKELTKEQVAQLMALYQQGMMGAIGGGAGAKGKLSKPKKNFGYFFSLFIKRLQSFVAYLDLFIDLVANKHTKEGNDVVWAARSPILFGSYVIIIFFLFGGLWSAFAPINSAAVAIGMLIPDSNRKIISHQEGGVIHKIFVKQGDVVQKGDKLIEFDYVRIKSQYENLLNQYRNAMATENRLIAERDNNDTIEFSEFLNQDINLPEVYKIIQVQQNLFRSKKEAYKSEQDALEQRVIQLNKQIEGMEARKSSAVKNAHFIKDRLAAAKKLLDKNFVQKSYVLELETKESSAVGEVATIESEIARLKEAVTQSNIESINLKSKYTASILNELKETQVALTNVKEQYLVYKDLLDKVVVKSPVDGVVNAIYHHTIGGVVRATDPILEISPANDALIIEAKVSHKNIDVVHAGLVAKIKFSAFKSRTAPSFTGKVVSVSPDVVQDRAYPQQQEPYYVARIQLNMEEFNEIANKRNLHLQPGMQAEIQIVTGTRTLLQYLLSPLTDVMFKAFREK